MKLYLILSALVLTCGLVSCSKTTDASADVDSDTATDVASLPEDVTAADADDVSDVAADVTDVTATDVAVAADVTADTGK